MKPIAILGSGPAGLMAAHVAGILGKPIAIFSAPIKSHISGAQFLHAPVPDIQNANKPDATILYTKRGNAQDYQRKVYGDSDIGFVRFGKIKDGELQSAWHLQAAYDQLWDFCKDSINEVAITPKWIDDHANDFDMIISAIPAPALCRTLHGDQLETAGPKHTFAKQGIWLLDETVAMIPENSIMYSGDLSQSWYRTSNLFGHQGTEWSKQGPQPPLPNLREGIKPVFNNCNCFPDVLRVGRYGEWTKGVLLHHAMQKTIGAIREM